MKILVSIAIISSLMFSSISKLWTIIDFKINQSRIIKELCENRDKPMLNCNGKCYLAKQMEAQEKEEREKLPPLQKEKVEIIYFTNSTTAPSTFFQATNSEKQHQYHHKSMVSQQHLNGIFRPPISA